MEQGNFVVIWRVGGQKWHVNDAVWPTRRHAEMSAELFKLNHSDLDVEVCEVIVGAREPVAA